MSCANLDFNNRNDRQVNNSKNAGLPWTAPLQKSPTLEGEKKKDRARRVELTGDGSDVTTTLDARMFVPGALIHKSC
jgi:hypothetical protein